MSLVLFISGFNHPLSGCCMMVSDDFFVDSVNPFCVSASRFPCRSAFIHADVTHATVCVLIVIRLNWLSCIDSCSHELHNGLLVLQIHILFSSDTRIPTVSTLLVSLSFKQHNNLEPTSDHGGARIE